MITIIQRTLEYGVNESNGSINAIIDANKYRNMSAKTGKKYTICVPQKFIQSLIDTLQLK